MKKTIAFLLIVCALLICAAACGVPTAPEPAPADTPAPVTTPAPTPEPTPEPEPEPEVEYPPVVETARADIAIVGTEIYEFDGKFYFKVVFDYTNKTEGMLTLARRYSIGTDAFQNGERLDQKFSVNDGSEELKYPDIHIAPGVTARAATLYELLDTESEVIVKLTGGSPSQEVTLDPNNLLPQKPWPERNPSLNPPLESENFMGEEFTFEFKSGDNERAFHLKLLGHELFEHDGNKYIRVRYEFTAGAKNDSSMLIYGNLNSRVIQDGIMLGEPEWSNPELKLTDEDNAISSRVEPGTTIIFAQVYKLASNSPVLVNIGHEYWDFSYPIAPPYIGGVFNVK